MNSSESFHDESLEPLRSGCEDVKVVCDKLNSLQAQWMREAQSWLEHHRNIIKCGSLADPSSQEIKPGAVFTLDSCLKHASSDVLQPSRKEEGEISQGNVCVQGVDDRNVLVKSCSSINGTAENAALVPVHTSRTSDHSGISHIPTHEERDEQLKEAAHIVENLEVEKMSIKVLPSRTNNELRNLLQRIVVSSVFRIVVSSVFRTAVTVAITTNLIFVGVEAQYLATHTEEQGQNDLFETIQLGYSVFFLLEVGMRLIAEPLTFFVGIDWRWNIFDLLVVSSAIVETIASSTMDMTHVRIVRIYRMTRLVRTVRIFKMVRFIRALRTLVQSILSTLKCVFWSLLLLSMFVYGFAVAFAQAVIDTCGHKTTFRSHLAASGCNDPRIEQFWGSLPRAMLTLFESVMGGINWHDPVLALGQISGVWVSLFILYIILTVFAVLNVVTGVFCQSAMESVQEDKEMKTMQLMANRNLYEEALMSLFDEIDENGSDEITLSEFEKSLSSERGQAYFASLEISVTDAWALFKLLDANNDGTIDRKEFLMGCIQYQGGAKAVDIAKMAYESQALFSMFEECMQRFDEQLQLVMDALSVSCDVKESAETSLARSLSQRMQERNAKRKFSRKWHSSFELDACSREHLSQVFL